MKKAPLNTSKYQISAKSVKGFGGYKHLNFRPTCRLKYTDHLTVVTSQTFLLPLCRIHQA